MWMHWTLFTKIPTYSEFQMYTIYFLILEFKTNIMCHVKSKNDTNFDTFMNCIRKFRTRKIGQQIEQKLIFSLCLKKNYTIISLRLYIFYIYLKELKKDSE